MPPFCVMISGGMARFARCRQVRLIPCSVLALLFLGVLRNVVLRASRAGRCLACFSCILLRVDGRSLHRQYATSKSCRASANKCRAGGRPSAQTSIARLLDETAASKMLLNCLTFTSDLLPHGVLAQVPTLLSCRKSNAWRGTGFCSC